MKSPTKEELAEFKKKHGITSKNMAHTCLVDQQRVEKWMNGTEECPGLEWKVLWNRFEKKIILSDVE
jgi:DNA-binding transcriptional regulator YiaG